MSETPETPGDSTKQGLEAIAKASGAIRQSAGFRDIGELGRKMKLLQNAMKPSPLLAESAQKLASIQSHIVRAPMASELPMPEIPPHPAHETNRRLSELNTEVEGLRTAQTEMITVLQTMVKVQTGTDRKTAWIVALSAIAIVVAILLGTRVI